MLETLATVNQCTVSDRITPLSWYLEVGRFVYRGRTVKANGDYEAYES